MCTIGDCHHPHGADGKRPTIGFFSSRFAMFARLARLAAPIATRALASPIISHTFAMRSAALAGSSVLAAALAAPAALAEPAPIVGMTGEAGTKRERTLILIKPDGVERGIVGGVISKFEVKGYKLVAMKMFTPTLDEAKANYAGLSKLPFFPSLCAYFASGPVVALCFEGKDVIKTGRAMVDEIRGTYAADRGRNCIDGSDSVEGAAEELERWFSYHEMQNYTRAIDSKIYA